MRPADYPRRCGDEFMASSPTQSTSGLPPQVRGRARAGERLGGRGRTTPAGAGTSLTRTATMRSISDYPRRCGDERVGDAVGRHEVGLPPQVRGRDVAQDGRGLRARTTPAGAGTSSRWPRRGWARWDYPRRCGDEVGQAAGDGAGEGLPPQVRGRVPIPARPDPGLRTTPAGAGTRLGDLQVYRRGRAISITPSKSTGFHRSRPAVRTAHPCSLLAGSAITA